MSDRKIIYLDDAIDAICKACQYDTDDYADCPDRAPSSLFCDYMNALRQLPSAQPEWIPCSERLPEEGGEYLCTLLGVHNTGLPSECGYEPPNNRGITSGWSTCEADGFKFLRDDEVLAWMPLPEPWKGEQE